MSEVGLHQQLPTVIYQDNMAAIQIAMNIRALAKKTRAMSTRTLSVRNKVEDGKAIPIYLKTLDMVADIGTKALDATTFERHRDVMTGYLVVGKSGDNENIVMLMQRVMTYVEGSTTYRETKMSR